MSLNFLLLFLFSKTTGFGSGVKALSERYNVLTVIYTNLTFILMLIIYEIMFILFKFPNIHLLTFLIVCCVILDLALLRLGRVFMATMGTLGCMHMINFSCSYLIDIPMIGFYALIVIPNFLFSVTSSKTIQAINGLLCLAQFGYHIYIILGIFEVTLTNEQYMHILTLFFGGFLSNIFVFIINYFKKNIETDIWKIAQSNHEKSENLTKNLVQTLTEKDDFMSELSISLKAPIEEVLKSIDYLMGTIKNPDHLQILTNMKLCTNFQIGMLDDGIESIKSKIQASKLSYEDTNFTETVKKAMRLNAENMRKNDITSQIYIDENLPPLLRIDPTIVLQITKNFLSNAIKTIVRKGKIWIIVTWCSESQGREKLLAWEDCFQNINLGNQDQNTSFILDSAANNLSLPLDSENMDEFNKNDTLKRAFSIKKTYSTVQLKRPKEPNSPTNLPPKTEPWAIYKKQVLNRTAQSRPQIETGSLFMAHRASSQHSGYLKFQISSVGECELNNREVLDAFFNGKPDEGVGSNTCSDPKCRNVHIALKVCKEFCLRMEGDVAFYSKPDRGQTFVFYIPVDNAGLNGYSPYEIGNVPEKINVMIVDSYASSNNLQRLLFEREGVNVVSAFTGKEALEQYKLKPDGFFKFIIIDTHVSEFDGFRAVNMLRVWEEDQHLCNIDIYFTSDVYESQEEVLRHFQQTKGNPKKIYYLNKFYISDTVRTVLAKYRDSSRDKSPSWKQKEGSVNKGRSFNDHSGIRNRVTNIPLSAKGTGSF